MLLPQNLAASALRIQKNGLRLECTRKNIWSKLVVEVSCPYPLKEVKCIFWEMSQMSLFSKYLLGTCSIKIFNYSLTLQNKMTADTSRKIFPILWQFFFIRKVTPQFFRLSSTFVVSIPQARLLRPILKMQKKIR